MSQSTSCDPLKFAELRREHKYNCTIDINIHWEKIKPKSVFLRCDLFGKVCRHFVYKVTVSKLFNIFVDKVSDFNTNKNKHDLFKNILQTHLMTYTGNTNVLFAIKQRCDVISGITLSNVKSTLVALCIHKSGLIIL